MFVRNNITCPSCGKVRMLCIDAVSFCLDRGVQLSASCTCGFSWSRWIPTNVVEYAIRQVFNPDYDSYPPEKHSNLTSEVLFASDAQTSLVFFMSSRLFAKSYLSQRKVVEQFTLSWLCAMIVDPSVDAVVPDRMALETYAWWTL